MPLQQLQFHLGKGGKRGYNEAGQMRKMHWNEILRIKYNRVFTSQLETCGAKWKEHTLQPRYPHLCTEHSPVSLVWLKYNSPVVKV